LAEVLCLARACQAADINNIGDIIFGATVGEEGAGNLRGVKAFFSEHDDIDGFLSIDGPRPYQIVYLGTGSFRYTITYKGPGGHSFGAFGVPSATHALGRAVADIANLQTTENPRTTFTVGEIKGGTSVNAIAEEASMNVDLRSNDKDALNTLTDKFLAIVKKAAEDENNRWGSDQLTVTIERFGDRPPSSQSKDDMIVQTAFEAIQSIGKEPILSDPSSTDANYPMSIGIPSLALGRGGRAGGTHTLDEWYDPTDAFIGVQKNFLTLLGLVGVEGISQPLLAKRNE
ncbi:MAG TPA: M20/M25/M40 family metallo-hydrolase, partial [Virgibacillus sp.]|nr:M20/M25/M40 family metallo-hydrolase [Virgibacillus sp.]